MTNTKVLISGTLAISKKSRKRAKLKTFLCGFLIFTYVLSIMSLLHGANHNRNSVWSTVTSYAQSLLENKAFRWGVGIATCLGIAKIIRLMYLHDQKVHKKEQRRINTRVHNALEKEVTLDNMSVLWDVTTNKQKIQVPGICVFNGRFFEQVALAQNSSYYNYYKDKLITTYHDIYQKFVIQQMAKIGAVQTHEALQELEKLRNSWVNSFNNRGCECYPANNKSRRKVISNNESRISKVGLDIINELIDKIKSVDDLWKGALDNRWYQAKFDKSVLEL